MGPRRGGACVSEHLAILLAALVLDAVFGEPDWLWARAAHPAVLMGRLLSRVEAVLYGQSRGLGTLCLVLCIGVVGGASWGLAQLGPWIEAICAATLLAHRSLIQHVQRVADDLRISIEAARDSVAMIVSRDTGQMDQAQVSRAAIESAAENLSDGVIAPAFWCLIGGLPGIAIYKMVNTADSMIGYRTERYNAFGWAAARLDDVLNWVPARLTGLGFWLVGGLRGPWSDITADARRHKSPNAGWPEAALARALGIALAGPRPYHGEMQDLPWVNPRGLRNMSAPHIDAAIGQLWRVWALLGMVVAIGLFVSWGI